MCKHPTINHDLFLEHNRLLLFVCTQYDNRERELKFNMLRVVLDGTLNIWHFSISYTVFQ